MFIKEESARLIEYLKRHHELYLSIFNGRDDIVAQRWDKSKTYGPICFNRNDNEKCPRAQGNKAECAKCANKVYNGITSALLDKHFDGKLHLGCYPLQKDTTTWFVAADFDNHDSKKPRDPLADVQRLVKVARRYGVPLYVLSSRSGKGFHGYLFFDEAVSAGLARGVMLGMLAEAGIDVQKNEGSFDRLFPSQVKHSGAGYGNLIGMPFQGEVLPKGCTVFVNPDSGQAFPVDEQIATLENIKRVSTEILKRLPQHEDDHEIALPIAVLTNGAALASYTPFIVPTVIVSGSRNDTIFKLACSLISKGLNESTIRVAAHAENVSKCAPPLDPSEVDAIVTSAISRYPQPQNATTGTFHLTDLGNAERFVAQHGDKLRYSSARKQWLVWDGKRFQEDELNAVNQLAYGTVRSIYTEASGAASKDERQAISKHASASENGNRIEQMVKLAKAQPGIPIRQDQLDADPWLINCQNGILDLKTQQLEKHDPNRLMTKVACANYDREAHSPLWDSFLKRIFDNNEALITYMRKVVGVALTGKTLQALFILHGNGANGKSTFLEVIRRMLGDYAHQADFNTFIEQKNQTVREDLASLCGARVVMASESDNGKYLSEALVKQITGGEAIRSRFLYGRSFEYVPTFNIFLATNHKPNVQGTDLGIWRRLKLIPFTVTIPEKERDEELLDKLLTEMPGIFAWAVGGCAMWQQEGIEEPEEVKAATRAYRDDNDILNDFIAERIEHGSGYMENQKDMYIEYTKWCEENGVKRPFAKQLFNSKLHERGWVIKNTGGKHWLGVRIKQETFGDDMYCDNMNQFE